MSELLQLPATISRVQTMANKSVRVMVDSQEDISPEVVAQIMKQHEQLGWFCFLVDRMIKPEDVKDLPEIKDETDVKSPSQRLRGVLFIQWENQTLEYKSKYPFEVYYRGRMEKIIDREKEKLA